MERDSKGTNVDKDKITPCLVFLVILSLFDIGISYRNAREGPNYNMSRVAMHVIKY